MKTLVSYALTALASASLGTGIQYFQDARNVATILDSSSWSITENVEQAAAMLDLYQREQPKITRHGTGWSLEHVQMPACPDDHKRIVDAPERDEVDALSVYCVAR